MHVGTILRRAREARGISQLDLALTIGVSQRHVSFIENGRSRPSRSLIETWARETQAPPSLRNAALHGAGYAPRHPGRSLDDDDPAPAALKRMLAAHEPCAGLVFDADWMCRFANEGASWLIRQLLPDFVAHAAASDGRFDMIEALAHPGGLLSRMVDPWLGGGALLDQLRSEAWARPPLGPRIDRFERSMIERFGLRGGANSRAPGEPCLNLRFETDHGPMGFVTFESIFALPQDVTLASLRVELWFPVDERTRRIMHERPGSGSTGVGHPSPVSQARDEEQRRGQKYQRKAGGLHQRGSDRRPDYEQGGRSRRHPRSTAVVPEDDQAEDEKRSARAADG